MMQTRGFESGFKEIYKEKIAGNLLLFQFGVFKFHAGVSNTDTLYFQSVATRENDLRLMGMNMYRNRMRL